MNRGTKIYYTLDNLGGTAHPGGGFDGSTANAGDEGVYIRPMPEIGEDDWHLTLRDNHYFAVHESMFEAA